MYTKNDEISERRKGEQKRAKEGDDKKLDLVVCPNFGHPALTLSFTKYKLLHNKSFLREKKATTKNC